MMDLLESYMRAVYQNGLYKGPPTPVDTTKGDKPQKEMGFLNEIMNMSGGNEAPAGTTTVGGKSYSPVYGPTGGYGYTGGKTYKAPSGTTVSGGQSHKPFG